jgi:hypothetical protein
MSPASANALRECSFILKGKWGSRKRSSEAMRGSNVGPRSMQGPARQHQHQAEGSVAEAVLGAGLRATKTAMAHAVSSSQNPKYEVVIFSREAAASRVGAAFLLTAMPFVHARSKPLNLMNPHKLGQTP